jgi:hypothetical protein
MKTTKRNRISRSCASLAALSLLLAALWSAPAVAQFTTAQLSGIVTDNAGSVVAGANVTVQEVQTGYKQTVKTRAAGEYLFPSLPVGNYELTVDMTGFSSYVQKGIVLTVGQAASRNVALQVGAVTDQVTVTANASLVTTDSPTVG